VKKKTPGRTCRRHARFRVRGPKEEEEERDAAELAVAMSVSGFEGGEVREKREREKPG
jgi:hypothetical protein